VATPPSRRRPERRRRPHLDPGAAHPLLIAGDPEDSLASVARGRARFEAALAAGPIDGGRPDDLTALRALADAPIEGTGRLLYGSNAVFLLEFDAPDPSLPDEPLRAIYKPTRGERPLWDFPRHTLYLRETAAYVVDAALDLGHVPPTVLRDGPLGPGSVQLFVHPVDAREDQDDAGALELQLREIAMLDVLINNADRKRAHLIVTAGSRVRAIDNALTFLPYPRQRTALISLGGTRLPRSTAERVSSLANDAARLEALGTRLTRLLSRDEVDAFLHRVRELAADPVYPVLDDWDGRPFEWW
jgi:hypothetical protein